MENEFIRMSFPLHNCCIGRPLFDQNLVTSQPPGFQTLASVYCREFLGSMAKVLRGGKWGSINRDCPVYSPSTFFAVQKEEGAACENDNANGSGVIVAFFEERQRMGVACYDLSSNEIHIANVSTDAEYSSVATVVKQQDCRVVVLPTSYRHNDKLVSALHGSFYDQVTKSTDAGLIGFQTSTGQENAHTTSIRTIEDEKVEMRERIVSFLANTEFGVTKATELCGLIDVYGMPSNLDAEGKFVYLSHLLGEEECILRAVGGLLSFVLQNGVLGTIGEKSKSIAVNAIRPRNYCEVMKISPTTLRALHVFRTDTHPVGRGSMASKEGLSLYGMLKSHVKTASGRKLLRSWLLYPSTNVEIIRNRQFVVDFLQSSSNSAVLLAIKQALRGVKNVSAILWRLKKISAGVSDWKGLYSSLRSFITISDALRIALQHNPDLERSPLLLQIAHIKDGNLRGSVGWIDAIVDFQESAMSGRMVVAQGFSEEIDELKRCYSGLDKFLTSVGVQEHTKLLDQCEHLSLESLQFTYQPQIGYLVVLSHDDCERIGLESLGKLGMSFVFSSAHEGYHFKSERCRELDDELGDIHGSIIDLEAKAMRSLEEKLFTYSQTTFETAKLVRELDCLQAFACSAKEYSWNRPTVDQEASEMVVEEGRHPIVEVLVSSFVPNTTKVKFGDVHILTGCDCSEKLKAHCIRPNYSGKSVYLLQVAAIIVLAQIGSFIPAEKARLPIIDTVNSRASSFESVAYGQSSFFMDSCQVSAMLAPTSGRSLHIIDEFGKGTSEVDGMALLSATLRRMLAEPVATAPMCICATHFAEILREPFLPLSNPRVATFSMEIMTRQNPRVGHHHMDGFRKLLSVQSQAARNDSTGSNVLSKSTAKSGRFLESGKPVAANILPAGESRESLGAIVRTYRLLPGSICHESRALQCALEVGVPRFLLQRAAHVRDALSGTRVIGRSVATEETSRRIRICATTVRRFLSHDFTHRVPEEQREKF